jgi:hypothetical protein
MSEEIGERSPKELVWMEHPAMGPDRKQQTTLKQLENVWYYSGWRETEAPPPPPPKEDPVPLLSDYNVAELRAMAKDAGIEGAYKMKKGALLDALSED